MEWRRQRSRWMFKGYPRRKKAEGGTRRVQGGVFHRHGGQGLTQVLRETQSLCLSVWRSVQCGWARCESKRLGPIRHLTMPGGFSAVLLMVTRSLPQRLSPLNPTSVQIIIRRYGGGCCFPQGLGSVANWTLSVFWKEPQGMAKLIMSSVALPGLWPATHQH